MLKECLKNNIVPFITDDEIKLFYYRGLKMREKKKKGGARHMLFGTRQV